MHDSKLDACMDASVESSNEYDQVLLTRVKGIRDSVRAFGERNSLDLYPILKYLGAGVHGASVQ